MRASGMSWTVAAGSRERDDGGGAGEDIGKTAGGTKEEKGNGCPDCQRGTVARICESLVYLKIPFVQGIHLSVGYNLVHPTTFQ